MPLVLYNSLTRRKEPFVPLDPARVGIYVCGPTVYDEAHIGNARAVVAFDLLYRVLRHEYGEGHVTYVRNITDVEDKIMAAARVSGQTIDQVTARTTAQFHADMAALGNLPPDIEPRATEYMSEMTLGETFDIHGGGLDLIFPHHENEIAQSVCAHGGRPFARYWLHNGMLTVGGTKMAKSEGNFITVREALAEAPGEVIRLALLSTHYRDPLDWTPDKLRQARTILDRFYRALSLPGQQPAG